MLEEPGYTDRLIKCLVAENNLSDWTTGAIYKHTALTLPNLNKHLIFSVRN